MCAPSLSKRSRTDARSTTRQRNVKRPRTRKPNEQFLSIEECKALLSVAAGRDRLIVSLFLVLGLRPSELFALRDTDVLPGILRIDEAVVLGVVGETKTDDSM